MTILKKSLLLFLISSLTFSQNITIKYSGDSDNTILLTCQAVEVLQSPTVLNKEEQEFKNNIRQPDNTVV